MAQQGWKAAGLGMWCTHRDRGKRHVELGAREGRDNSRDLEGLRVMEIWGPGQCRGLGLWR